MAASKIPFLGLVWRLVKNPTVSGSIGKIQGSNNAARPPMNPAINIVHKFKVALAGAAGAMIAACLTEVDLTVAFAGATLVSAAMGVNCTLAVLAVSA